MEQPSQPPPMVHTELLCRPHSSLLSSQPQRVDAGAVEIELDHVRDGHEWVEEGEAASREEEEERLCHVTCTQIWSSRHSLHPWCTPSCCVAPTPPFSVLNLSGLTRERSRHSSTTQEMGTNG
ncbi:Os10g0484566 [Oryza sativa Japonica Group]|uniref:Os10g0484566 protein n=1 Tax=Oryza sativa subsp. japonica TaxID=39947 RepID=A0A0P0XW18_ORYSJ|nr:Os10g0484566 [Oryza sativa Japonica Group]